MTTEGGFLMTPTNREDPLAKPYIPIDTDLVDDIEHFCSDQIHVDIEYKDRDGSPKHMRGFIADVYTTKDSEEYLKMMDGRSIRLDQLIAIVPKATKAQRPARDTGVELEERLNIKDNKFFPNSLG
jgi:hypothetical protein